MRILNLSLSTLAILCFITVFVSQTRLKISKEPYPEVIPQVLKNKETLFLWTFGNPDVNGFVLKIVILAASPLTSLFSTSFLLFGKSQKNPYLFLPWIMLTISGLLTVQINNLETISKNFTNDWKFMVLNLTISLIVLYKYFILYEVLMTFKTVWNKQSDISADNNF